MVGDPEAVQLAAPRTSLAKLAERLSLILLVGGIVFQFITGMLYVDYYEVYSFSLLHRPLLRCVVVHGRLRHPRGAEVPGHGARAALAPAADRAAHARSADTRPEDRSTIRWSPTDPAAPTISRRGVLALVGGSSLLIFVLTAGETIGGWTRRFALFGTHDRSLGVRARTTFR